MNVPGEETEIQMNSADLYREEIITDRRAGLIRRLVPVKSDGLDDSSRAVRFEGQTTILTPGGALPLTFEIEAHTMPEALAKFSGAAQLALAQMLQDLEELRRERASPLIVPGQSGLDVGNLRAPGVSKITRP
jgi:hypothetical protein